MYNMQCRGEWKLARGDSNPGNMGGCAMRMWRATSQSPLQLRGVNVVHIVEKYPGVNVSERNHHVTWIDDSCGNDIWGVAVTVGITSFNPRLNMDYPLSGIDCMCGGRPPSRPYSYAM